MSSRIKNSVNNMISGFVYQALSLILSFVSRTVFIHTLGSEYLGLNGIFSDVLTLLSMADLGFNTAMAYTFYKPLANNDQQKLTSLVAFYKKVYNVIAIAVTVLGVLCIPFLKLIVNTEKDIPNLTIYYLFSLAGVVISYLYVYKTTIITADQKNYVVVKINIYTSLIKTILQIGVLYLFKNYILYLAIGVIVQYINNIIASKKAEKMYPYIKDVSNTEKIDKEVSRSIWKNMKSVFIYKFSGTMFNATDNIIISVLIGTATVGVYSNYLMVSSKLLLVAQIIFSALTASIGNVIVKETPEKRYEVFSAMQSASFIFCGIITSAFCILSNDLVEVWLGSSFKLSDITIVAITLNTYLGCVLHPLWIYRDATGIYMKTKYVMLVGAALNIVLSLLLGYFIGLPGIIFASAISRLTTYFWYEPKLLFKEYFKHRVMPYYLSLLGNICLVAATIFLMNLLTKSMVVNSWPSLILKGVVIGIGCVVIFCGVYSRTEGFRIILNKIKTILKR